MFQEQLLYCPFCWGLTEADKIHLVALVNLPSLSTPWGSHRLQVLSLLPTYVWTSTAVHVITGFVSTVKSHVTWCCEPQRPQAMVVEELTSGADWFAYCIFLTRIWVTAIWFPRHIPEIPALSTPKVPVRYHTMVPLHRNGRSQQKALHHLGIIMNHDIPVGSLKCFKFLLDP